MEQQMSRSNKKILTKPVTTSLCLVLVVVVLYWYKKYIEIA